MNEKELLLMERVVVGLAMSAGQMMTNASGLNREVKQKESFADLVTETDREVERFLFTQLKHHFPDHRFVGEETSAKVGLTSDPTWVIDPIDGTMNFVHTFPFVCVSIALVVNKAPVLGVVFSPFLNKLYTARKGFGAYCNGRPISVQKNCHSLNESLIFCEFGGQRDEEKRNVVFRNLEAIGWVCHGIRSMGSAALNLCYIAEGYGDAYWEFGLHVWDMAAAAVILTEAGGTLIDTQGGPVDLMSRRMIGACNEKIANQLSESLVIHIELERD